MGCFDFGYINISLVKDNIIWFEFDLDSVYWDVEFDLILWIGGEKVWWYYKFIVIIDMGIIFMFMFDVFVFMYWFFVFGMKIDLGFFDVYIFFCFMVDDFLDFCFKFFGMEYVFNILGRYMNYGFIEESLGYCWGGMQSVMGFDVLILGDMMLKVLFFVFDFKKGWIGFVNKDLGDE